MRGIPLSVWPCVGLSGVLGIPSGTGCSGGEGGSDNTGESDFGGREDRQTFVEQPNVSAGNKGKDLLELSTLDSSDCDFSSKMDGVEGVWGREGITMIGFEFLLGGGESGVTSGAVGTIGNGRIVLVILEDKSEGAATGALAEQYETEEKIESLLVSWSLLFRTSDSSLKDKIFSPIGVAG